MGRKTDPKELLEEVLLLIERDVEEIKLIAGKLEADVASTLTRYSDALLKITKKKNEDEDEDKEKLANMSDAELKERAKRYLENK